MERLRQQRAISFSDACRSPRLRNRLIWRMQPIGVAGGCRANQASIREAVIRPGSAPSTRRSRADCNGQPVCFSKNPISSPAVAGLPSRRRYANSTASRSKESRIRRIARRARTNCRRSIAASACPAGPVWRFAACTPPADGAAAIGPRRAQRQAARTRRVRPGKRGQRFNACGPRWLWSRCCRQAFA